MDGLPFRPRLLILIALLVALGAFVDNSRGKDENPLELPSIGTAQLLILAPTTLELCLITAKPAGNSQHALWDFIKPDGKCALPSAEEFIVSDGSHNYT